MGLFKQVKELRDMTVAAPGMVRGARELGAQAQEMAAAQQAAAQEQLDSYQPLAAGAPASATAGVSDADLEPISGVSLEKYAEISKGLAAHGYDQSKAVEVAASKGVSADSWETAVAGWNERIKANRAVGQHFNRLYTGS